MELNVKEQNKQYGLHFVVYVCIEIWRAYFALSQKYHFFWDFVHILCSHDIINYPCVHSPPVTSIERIRIV
jgi:hypothetical protein